MDKPSYIHIYIAQTAHIFPFLLFPRWDILIQLTTEYYLKESTFGLKPLHSEYEKFGVAATSVLSCRLVTAFLFFYLVPSWHEAEKKVVWFKLTHTKTKKRWANALIPVRTKCPRGAPPYIVRMHTA